jgi:glycosyltransferase involved in cell wall biosynthesis
MTALSVITPVRDRPRGFALCERWMKSQTFTDFEWIVVDDGDHPIKPTMGQIYVRRKPSKKRFTLDRNFTAGSKFISGDAVTLLEDDDWRGPNYLAGMMEALESADVSVTAGFYSYNVKYRFWDDRRESHERLYKKTAPLVSLHAGFVGEAAEHFVEKMETGLKARPFWTYVWKRFKVKLFDGDMVAIKGIIGRSWIGARHKGSLYPRKNIDSKGRFLTKLVGKEDAVLLLKAGR